MTFCICRVTGESTAILLSIAFLLCENELSNSKSCCVTKIFVPFGIHIESGWANTGLDALQGILKVFHLDVTHL